jgi:hypothetical protein
MSVRRIAPIRAKKSANSFPRVLIVPDSALFNLASQPGTGKDQRKSAFRGDTPRISAACGTVNPAK